MRFGGPLKSLHNIRYWKSWASRQPILSNRAWRKSVGLADTNDAITRLAEESCKTLARCDAMEHSSRERDDQFRDRIASLVSAIGQLLPPKA